MSYTFRLEELLLIHRYTISIVERTPAAYSQTAHLTSAHLTSANVAFPSPPRNTSKKLYLTRCIRYGFCNVLRWIKPLHYNLLESYYSTYHEYFLVLLGLSGHHGLVDWYHHECRVPNKTHLDHAVMQGLAKGGHRDLLEFLHVEYYYPLDPSMPAWAAGSGSIDAVKWARSKGIAFCYSCASNAAANGDLEMLQYLHVNGCPWDSYTTSNAARSGNLELLKYAIDNGCGMSDSITFAVAYAGDIETMQYVRSKGASWSVQTLANAAFCGHLNLVMWLVENGCPVMPAACVVAALGGHLSIVQYWILKGLPYDRERCLTSECARFVRIKEWILQNTKP